MTAPLPDVLENGSDRPPRWAALGPGTPRRRRAVALLLVVAVLGGSAVVLVLRVLPPSAPALTVAVDPGSEQLDPVAQLSEGAPAGPTHVELSGAVSLADPSWARPGRTVTLLGVTGPGVDAATLLPPSPQLSRAAPSVGALILGADLDCAAVQPSTPADAYRLRVVVRDGDRVLQRLVPLGAASASWAERVHRACTWVRTEQQLSVTDVSAVVDPRQPALDLSVVVHNAGPLAASAWTTAHSGWGNTVDPAVPAVPVPAQGTATLHTRLTLGSCLSWAQLTLPTTTQETPLPLVGSVGSSADPPHGWDPPGVPLSPTAARQLEAALTLACGGISTPVAEVVPGASSYDPGTQTLTTRIVVQLPGGRVRQARVVAPNDVAAGSLTPLFDTTAWQAPDASGRLQVTVRFRAAQSQPCLVGAPFLVFYLDARVPGPDGERQLRFAMSAEVAPPGAAATFLCSD